METNVHLCPIKYMAFYTSIDKMDPNSNHYLHSTLEVQKFLDGLTEKHKNPICEKLAPYLLAVIDDSYPAVDNINEIMEKTGLSARQIRDYFRNQRKRYFAKISGLIDDDKSIIEHKLEFLYQYIDKIIDEYVGKGKTCQSGDQTNWVDEYKGFDDNRNEPNETMRGFEEADECPLNDTIIFQKTPYQII
ncbi:hypothetical protein TRFO_08657 [Tritrichomonas foetus]|uniref:KN homeodomain domain-containing protein n=1 Tax=Tritrichomonas foetus TaxID=1144522 RepID=A0A1J4JIS6_9EUKA|nr:hypothetical protein TRFO_08657 [Tritrichomonas foetus]|eukprot:OHS99080.1 hypothetical protein TRFO_08657 [Tritrichomonas foetus]